jgi:hypothetical protein
VFLAAMPGTVHWEECGTQEPTHATTGRSNKTCTTRFAYATCDTAAHTLLPLQMHAATACPGTAAAAMHVVKCGAFLVETAGTPQPQLRHTNTQG